MSSNARWPLCLCAVVLALALTGCADTKQVFRYAAPVENQVWPEQPETPRYQYVGQLLGEQNFEDSEDSKKKVLVRVAKWIIGLGSGKRKPVVLQRPQAGVVGEDSRIYVTDVSRQAVFVFDRPAGRLHVWENADATHGFVAPIGIALGPNGQILVADAEMGLVIRLSATGEPLGSIGDGVLNRPTGVARDPATGQIYVVDTHDHDIKVFSDAGDLLRTIGQRGGDIGQFNSPTYISLVNGLLYVTDAMNARIQILTAEGDVVRIFGRRGLYVGDMPHPKGVSADSEGNIYVMESYFDHLLVFNSNGELLLPIGGSGQQVGQFYLPAGVWVDSNDRVYVADMFNGRVVILQYLGNKAGGAAAN